MMSSNIQFSKYHGAGNDFIFIEDFAAQFPENKELIELLCHRNFGIGADGLILARRSFIADFKMIYFNRDGSLANMCGNGLRCFGKFLNDLGFEKDKQLIEVGDQILTVRSEKNRISIFLKKPKELFWDLELGKNRLFVVDTGVPHAVIFSDLETDVEAVGRKIRMHKQFAPHGVNVNFAQVQGPNKIKVRTYERGVEKEVLACGTGASSVAYVAHRLGFCGHKLTVFPSSLQPIEIGLGEEIEMSGPVEKTFEGQICSFFQNGI